MKSKLEMYELPLFPLNVVLFPGMPLPLHIFEERYKEMMADCIRDGQPFGIIHLEESMDDDNPMIGDIAVGCTAEIAQVQPLDQGQMLIVAIGRERFRVVEFNHDRPYLVGLVTPAPLNIEKEVTEQGQIEGLEPLMIEYLHKLALVGNVDVDSHQVPTDPEALIYMAATLIQLPTADKQAFLALDRASDLTQLLQRAYRQELSLMQTIPSEDIGIFSLN